jgi:phytoene desaturase
VAKIVVLGAGLSGLASAALLAQAGHEVTVLEKNSWLGGKSRRIELAGQRMDTGPALVTFPEVWQQFLDTFDSLGSVRAKAHADLNFTRLREVGRYYLRNHVTDLPVKPEHHWFKAWSEFSNQHDALTPAISKLLTSHPLDPSALPALVKMAKVYGVRLTTSSYIKALKYMPEALKEVISIHTLNAGVSPNRTLALYASMTAAMASQGISVPVGGVNEIALALSRLATAAGAKIQLGVAVTQIAPKSVMTESGVYAFDHLVSSLDPGVLKSLQTGRPNKLAKHRSCSGVAIYAVLKQSLPEDVVTHSVIMPDDADQLHRSLDKALPPEQTMTFVNYYRAGEIYPNTKDTVAVLLTAPADGKKHDINSEWVRNELDRVSKKLGLSVAIDELFEEYEILNPDYFAQFGAAGGALYGATSPLWQSGPFHNPQYHNPLRPRLWRVGASVHPGGGIPAVLGGTLIATRAMLRKIGKPNK